LSGHMRRARPFFTVSSPNRGTRNNSPCKAINPRRWGLRCTGDPLRLPGGWKLNANSFQLQVLGFARCLSELNS
jgi:hypothetical protein